MLRAVDYASLTNSPRTIRSGGDAVAGRPAPRGPRRRACPALLAPVALALLAAGCRGVPDRSYERMDSPPEGVEAPRSDIPAWADDQLSWSKLREVERWLRTSSPSASPFWHIEAELQLADGRSTFARDDDGSEVPPETLAVRRRQAAEGYQRVLADSRALQTQRDRAERGLARLAGNEPEAQAAPSIARLVPRTAWRAAAINASRLTRTRHQWTRITVHHSADATPLVLDGTFQTSAAAVRRIQKAHMNLSPPYGDIGYHFVVDPEGRIFQGRELSWQGAHASGANNRGNIGICLLGNFEHDHPSPTALAALTQLVDQLRVQYGITSTHLHAHKEFKNTLCPGKHMMTWLNRYNREMARTSRARTASASTR